MRARLLIRVGLIAVIVVLAWQFASPDPPAPPVPPESLGPAGPPVTPESPGPSNVTLVRVAGPSHVPGGAPVVLTLDLRLTAVPAESLRLEVERVDTPDAASGTFLQPELLGLDELPGGLQRVRLACPTGETGLHLFRVQARIDGGDADPLDDAAIHAVHVGRAPDGMIRVLYVDGTARWEQQYLSNSLARDADHLRVHVLLLDADADTPQRATSSPGWEPLDLGPHKIPRGEDLALYDVVILGDVDWRDFGKTLEGSRAAVRELAELVKGGTGLLTIVGPRHMPTKYADTAIAALLPVQVDAAAEAADPRVESGDEGFMLRLTPQGARDSSMDIARDPERSRALWEEASTFEQFWSFPALRARDDAQVLAVSSRTEHANEFGPRPLLAYRHAGNGTAFYVGVDELWRMRADVGDRYFYGFYRDVVRRLAAFRLHGTRDLRTLCPERPRHSVGSPVTLRLTPGPFDPPGDLPPLRIRRVGGTEGWTVAPTADPTRLDSRFVWTPTAAGRYEVFLDTDPPLGTWFEVVE